MNPPKLTDEDYINFVIATPRVMSPQPKPGAFNRNAKMRRRTMLLTRLEPAGIS